MDKKTLPEAPYSAEMQMPGGSAYRGKLAVRGIHALLFFPHEPVKENWRNIEGARIIIQQPQGQGFADARLNVVINGSVGNGLDLTVTEGLSDQHAQELGMTLGGHRLNAQAAADYLASFNAEGLSVLGDSLRAFTLSLGDHLFDLSTSPQHGISGRHEHYDALNSLKKSNKAFITAMLDQLAGELAQPEKPRSKRGDDSLEDTDASELDLVELDEMEEKLALDRITTDAVNLYRVDLESLTLRAGDLLSLGAARVKTPFHPAYLCRGFRDGLHTLEFTPTVMQDSLKFFHREWIRKLRGFYARINNGLATDGLRPGLEDELYLSGSIMDANNRSAVRNRKSANTEGNENEVVPGAEAGGSGADAAASDRDTAVKTGSARGKRQSRRATDPVAEDGRSSAATDTAADQPRMKHDAMYDAVVHALSARNAVDAASSDADSDGTDVSQATKADPATVVQALLQLQQHHDWSAESDNSQSLRELLEQYAGQLPALAGGELQPESANRLDFIDNVFSTIRGSVDVADDVKPTLDQLRIPLARLSLEEPRFFADPEHPAHQMLDKLSQLATAENFPNRVLERKVRGIVDDIAARYDGDASVFQSALESLDRLVVQQETALRKNIERVVSTMEGQERLQQAQQSVERLLGTFIKPPSAPRVLLDLMDAGWRDLLVQIAVREGTDSQAWQDQVAALQKILSALQGIEHGDESSDALRELAPAVRSLQADIRAAQPDNLGHEQTIKELSQILRGEVPLETYAVNDVAAQPGITRSRLEQLPRLNRWIKRVEQLQIGTVMSYRDKQGFRRRMRLVWVSDDRERYAFVNELGKKVAEMSRIQLARKLSQGLKPPSSVDRMSVLNQSVYGTLADAQERLSFKRTRDSITRLINAASLKRQVERSVHHAQQHETAHAFLHLDIDSFHLVNDVYDEIDGDQVLAEFARLLSQLNEKRSLAARLDGDTFGILLAYRSMEEAMAFANRVRSDIGGSSITVAGEEVSFTTSIGVAPILQSTVDAEEVLRQARDAVFVAKERGGDRCVEYNLDEQQLIAYQREKTQSHRRLEDAIATDSLVLRAQPIVQSAMDGSKPASHHYEILLSIRQEDGELLSPTEFIRSAERFGYMNLVDRWVVRKVCEWISSLMDMQKVVPQLSINLSGNSLTNDTFTDYVLEQISEFGVGTSKICFEITETGAIENLTKAVDFVRTLRNIGCKFSLDDFGTGLASYSYLRELPVDYVKIDGTFITDILSSGNDHAMVRSINDLAHFLGQETIAECVETLEIVEPLRALGIDYLQGWGIGVPRELAEVTRELEALET
ncbi:MAG: DUF1631 family protein [Chromatocurvus sp.]